MVSCRIQYREQTERGIIMDGFFNDSWKVISLGTEIRYAPSPKFFDKKQNFLKEFMVELPNYDANTVDNLTMHSKYFPGVNLVIMPNRMLLSFEKFENKTKFIDMCKNKWQSILRNLNISIVERVGIRINLIKEMDEKKANEFTKQLINNQKLKEVTGLISSGVTLNFRELDKCVRVVISAGSFQSFTIDNNIQKQTNTIGLLVDIDYYIESQRPENVSCHFEQSFDKFDKLLRSFD